MNAWLSWYQKFIGWNFLGILIGQNTRLLNLTLEWTMIKPDGAAGDDIRILPG